MKTSTSRRKHACLVLAAVAAPASALSLSNFQLITASSVPFTCILAYDQQLSNCDLSDFTQQTQQQNSRQATGNTCSAACQSGIALAQQTIKTSCSSLVSGAGSSSSTSTSSSVLGVALTGDLVGLLCGGTNNTTSDVTSSSSSNVNGIATSEASTTSATPGNINTSFLTTINPVAAATTASNKVQQPAATLENTAEASLSSLLSSPSFLSQAVTTAQGAAAASSLPPGQSAIQSARPTTETRRSGNAAPPSPTVATEAVPKKTQSSSGSNADSGEVRGGGSPFDAAVVNSAAQRSVSLMAGVQLIIGGVAVLLMYRARLHVCF